MSGISFLGTHRTRGSVIILALIILALGVLLIPGLLVYASSALHQGTVIEDRTSQLYLADGGVEQAVFWINNPYSVNFTLPEAVGDSSSLQYSISNNIKYKTYVTYLGLINNYATCQVTSYAGPNILDNALPTDSQPGPYTEIVAQVIAIGGAGPPSIFKYAVTAFGGNIDLSKPNATITSKPDAHQGDIYADGYIDGVKQAEVDGNAQAGGAINTVQVDFTQTPNTPVTFQPIADITAGVQDQGSAAKNAPTQYDSSSYASGIHFLTGPVQLNNDLILTGNLTVNGDLYVNGSLDISGSLTVNANGSQKGALGVKNNLTISGSLSTDGTIYAGGNFDYSATTLDQKGNILIQGNVILESNSHPVIGSAKNLPVLMALGTDPWVMPVGKWSMYAFNYDPNADIDFTNGQPQNIQGAIFAKDVTVGNNTITFRTDYFLRSLPGPGSSTTSSIQTWNVSNH
jgi:cytoskeletal protein CcmA (bactofilin family)